MGGRAHRLVQARERKVSEHVGFVDSAATALGHENGVWQRAARRMDARTGP